MAAAKTVTHPVMKTSLLCLVLVVATGYSSLAFAASAGSRFASLVTAENLTGGFSIVFLGLIFVADYSRRTRLSRPKISASDRARREAHRLAA
jgi:hypothetical protein